MKNKLSVSTIGITASSVFVLSNTLFRSVEPRIRSIITISSGFLLAVFSKENPITLSIGFGLIVAGGVDTTNSMLGGSVRSNKFNGIIYYKKETNQKICQLNPFQTIGFINKIDGIATPFKPNHVFKIPNGCLVDILENGDIKLSYGFSNIINNQVSDKAEWKDKLWVESNIGWSNLLERRVLC